MPTPYIKKLSKEGKGSVPSLEKKWDKAKDAAAKSGHGEDYGYVTNIFKKMSHAGLQLQAKQRLKASTSQEDVLALGMDKRKIEYRRSGRTFWIPARFNSQAPELASLIRRIVEHFDTEKEGCYHDSNSSGFHHLFSPESEWTIEVKPQGMKIERIR